MLMDNYCLNLIVVQIERGMDTEDGAGVALKRVIGQPKLRRLDPFLMLDEFKSDKADDYINGFDWHPHRGFQTITYMIEGLMEHKDNKGNQGLLTPGSVQWMTAGSGLIHSEMPKQVEGLMHGYQFWLNLPIKDKMIPPSYQDIAPENIPEVKNDDLKVRVIAGKYQDVEGVIKGVVTRPLFLDVQLKPNVKFSELIPAGHTAFAFVFEEVKESHVGVFEVDSSKDRIEAVATEKGARFLLLAAQPLNEPVHQYGPMVLGSEKDLRQAFIDYQMGRF
ncbi:hypothetical protein DICPUDRAFT_94922 [Dictyostelium purpureum]|uniref:Pirin family protein n=1 Tax=Dictyostelium purpureum TaxID=5786 RepID=F0ZQ31_DICPU|nr:uncharacterized protein DICPUDRAFT_94922 [Dictyostelium purpureum]EGC33951.1 hypothetical protein DICPUDRAFT_94922 [Dictyostelium purpureum]|eukprot:XP_003289533.1 hypothetical protein DICPUDRAFT_94922 [Dictyostelium purpureum]